MNYTNVIFKRILSYPKDIAFVTSKLMDLHFEKNDKVLFKLIKYYYEETGGVITNKVLEDTLRSSKGATEEKIGSILSLYSSLLQEPEYTADELTYAVNKVKETKSQEVFVKSLQQSLEIVDSKLIEGKNTYEGFEGSQKYLTDKLSKLNMMLNDGMESSARAETGDIWNEYKKSKEHPELVCGVKTGINEVDRITNGIQKGELWTISAYSAQGKSLVLLNVAYNAMVAGKNVVIGSAEMGVDQYRRRLITRHTSNPKFKIPHGIAYYKIKQGKMEPWEEDKFKNEILPDFADNPMYGRVEIFQIPHGESVDFIRKKLSSYSNHMSVDLVILDYLSIIAPIQRRTSEREEISDLFKSCKQVALDFDGGQGVPIITAHQISREGYKLAMKDGKYNLTALSGSGEVERSSDLVWWLYRDKELIEQHQLKCGISKCRDGETIDEFFLYENFASSMVGNLQSRTIEL